MSLNLPPPIVQKTVATKQLAYKEGKLFLWDTPVHIDPVQIQVYKERLSEHHVGEDQTHAITYHTAKLQSMTGMKIVNQRFGYAKTLTDKKKLMMFNAGQNELLGLGKTEWIRINFETETFICNTVSAFAEEYRRFFGKQQHAVDFFLMGVWAGFIESLIEKPTLCIETTCVAKGDKQCQFTVKPVDKWDQNDPECKRLWHLTTKQPGFEELGAGRSTYTKL